MLFRKESEVCVEAAANKTYMYMVHVKCSHIIVNYLQGWVCNHFTTTNILTWLLVTANLKYVSKHADST